MKKEKKPNESLHHITFSLNGKRVSCSIKASTLLLDLIRDTFELKGTKPGCYEGECGACTVLINDAPVNSCLFLAVNANGKNITTIEGLLQHDGSLHPVQESLVASGAVQCGFCSSGMAMTIKALTHQHESVPHLTGAIKKALPSREEIKKYLEGNLCRCTGYVKIIDAAEKLFALDIEKNEKGI